MCEATFQKDEWQRFIHAREPVCVCVCYSCSGSLCCRGVIIPKKRALHDSQKKNRHPLQHGHHTAKQRLSPQLQAWTGCKTCEATDWQLQGDDVPDQLQQILASLPLLLTVCVCASL